MIDAWHDGLLVTLHRAQLRGCGPMANSSENVKRVNKASWRLGGLGVKQTSLAPRIRQLNILTPRTPRRQEHPDDQPQWERLVRAAVYPW